MQGLMQDWPLLCHKILDHAALNHGKREIVSRSVEGPIVRTTYADIKKRALKVAQLLAREGYKPGERIVTLAWNTARHLEAWYGIMGMGAVYHTLNPHLFPEQIAWIMNHAEDRAIFVDLTFMPIVEKIAPLVKSLKKVIVLTDKAHMPQSALPNVVAYEEWLQGADGDFKWVALDENAAAGMCYTSGTTGDPKGVVYSHRSNVLHAMIAAMPDAMGISSRDAILPVVPMFHANAWGLGQSAPLIGAKLVMPGGKMDGASIYELLDSEKVTFSAAVPTVWLMLLQHLEANNLKLPHLNKVVIGGSACPRVVTEKFEKVYGVEVIHAWGMTEMSPLGTVCTLKPKHLKMGPQEQMAVQAKQGRAVFGVDMKIVDAEGKELPMDGKASGELLVKGPWIVSQYFKGEGGNPLVDGWFPTGDVSTIDPDGYMQITDRSKDVIKSGGEWIGSIDIENIAMAHPAVAMAACIAAFHPKWDERPLLVVVKKPGAEVTRDELLKFFEGKIAKWWTPDDVVFADAIPLGATGKMQKNKLRETYKDHKLPTA